jgi:archaeal type IV pilus assembly protein PilA
MKQTESESAVSETIGTILIVALTVIMAALIAAYLFGMMSSVPQTRTVAATADQPDPTHILVTYRGGPDQALLANLTIIWPSGVSQRIDLPKVGDVYTATNVAAPYNVTPGKDHVVVTAIFANNMSQVILDTFV